ncbi:phage integrase SAM-like domain and Arm DNA-binding domain-containing protein [Bacteroides faecis]|uniref:phage integrase SAM-like domain and Arm DNA-binding domain-containing protein n=1 Tax=Bacteroides faecis TaxID=674529 RepID=UPI0039C0CE76
MATIKFYLDTRREKKDGLFPIKLNVHNKGTFFLSTGYSATREKWNGVEFTNKEVNYKTKNAALRKMISDMENAIFRLELDGKLRELSDKALKIIIEKYLPGARSEKVKYFVDYIADFIELKEKAGTKQVYASTLNKIVQFDATCTFDTMDIDWLRRFEKHMRDSGMKVNAYALHFRNIRSVFNYAIDNDLTTLYPFRKFRIKKRGNIKKVVDCGASCVIA